MLSAEAIVSAHDFWTGKWHVAGGEEDGTDSPESAPHGSAEEQEFLERVIAQHRTNFDLWHTEDAARTPGASDAEIADVKRKIDRVNQQRNDLAEELDGRLLAELKSCGLPDAAAPLHSESPGLMIDRLSILSLKIYHSREEAERADASADHVTRNEARLKVLLEQRADLARCLDELWRATQAGERQFKIYRQFKMYNDPTLNPAIYGKREQPVRSH